MPEGLDLGAGYLTVTLDWSSALSGVGSNLDAVGVKVGETLTSGLESSTSGTGAAVAEKLAAGIEEGVGAAGATAGEKIAAGVEEGVGSTGVTAGEKLAAGVKEGIGSTGASVGEKLAAGIEEGLTPATEAIPEKFAPAFEDVAASGRAAFQAMWEEEVSAAARAAEANVEDLGRVAKESEMTGSRIGGAFSAAGEKGGMMSEKILMNAQMAGQNLGPIGEGINQVTMMTQGLGGEWDKIPSKMGKVSAAATGVGVAVTGLGAILVEAGDKTEKSQAALENAIKNTGGSYDTFKGSIEGVVKTEANHGQSISETNQALQRLIQATGDTKQSVADMTTVDNLSAAMHVSLSKAATMVVQALHGKGRALTQLGIVSQGATMTDQQMALAQQTLAKAQENVTKATDAVTTANEKLAIARDAVAKKNSPATELALQQAELGVKNAHDNLTNAGVALTLQQDKIKHSTDAGAYAMDQINLKTKGAAAAMADTFGGKLDAVRTKLGNFVSQEGAHFGKYLTAAGPLLMGVGAAMDVGTKIAGHFAKGAEAAASAGEAMTAATEGTTVATDALAASETAELVPEGLALAPILLIVAALAAVALAGYELVTHWKEIWSDVKKWVGDGVDFVKTHLIEVAAVVLLPIAPLLLLWKFHKQIWTDIKAILADAGSFISGLLDKIVSFFAGLPDRIWHELTSLLDKLASFLLSAVVWVAGIELQVIEAVVGFFAGLPDRIWNGLLAVLSKLGDFITQGLAWATNVDAQIIEAVVGFFSKLPGRVVSALGDATKWLTHIGGDAVSGLWNGVTGALGWLGTQLASIPGDILRALGDATKWLESIGKDILTGLWNGISSAGGWFESQITGLIKKIVPGPIASLLGIHSPSTVFAEFGKNLMEGLALGVTGNAGMVHDSISKVAGNIGSTRMPHIGTVGVGASAASLNSGAGAGAVTIQPGAVVLNFNGPVDQTTIPQIQQVVTQAHEQLLSAIRARKPRAA